MMVTIGGGVGIDGCCGGGGRAISRHVVMLGWGRGNGETIFLLQPPMGGVYNRLSAFLDGFGEASVTALS